MDDVFSEDDLSSLTYSDEEIDELEDDPELNVPEVTFKTRKASRRKSSSRYEADSDFDADGAVESEEEYNPRKGRKSAGSSAGTPKIKLKLSGRTDPGSDSKERGGSKRITLKRNSGTNKRKKVEELSEDEEFDSETSFSLGGGSGSGRMTARQRAKETGESIMLESLPEVSKSIKMSDAELALKRSENSRRRKLLADKKLEEEKVETINRLLNKGADKTAKGGEELQKTVLVQAPVYPPPVIRYVSSIKSGEYESTLSFV